MEYQNGDGDFQGWEVPSNIQKRLCRIHVLWVLLRLSARADDDDEGG